MFSFFAERLDKPPQTLTKQIDMEQKTNSQRPSGRIHQLVHSFLKTRQIRSDVKRVRKIYAEMETISKTTSDPIIRQRATLAKEHLQCSVFLMVTAWGR